MAGKTGKKKGEGKKKGAGQRKKKTGPEMTWKEALLAYDINLKERLMEDVRYELKQIEDQNLRFKARNKRLKEEQDVAIANLLKSTKEFERSLNDKQIVTKEQVVLKMKENWEMKKVNEQTVTDLGDQIAKKEEEIELKNDEVARWREFESRGRFENDKTIQLLEQEKLDMEATFEEMSAHLKNTLDKAKEEIEKTVSEILDKQKYQATEKAIAKMDKYSRREVIDNDWLVRETELHRTETAELFRIVEALEEENLQLLSELFQCQVEDLHISRNFFMTQFAENDNLAKNRILEIDLAQFSQDKSALDADTCDRRREWVEEEEQKKRRRPKSAIQKAVEEKLFLVEQLQQAADKDEADVDDADGEQHHDDQLVAYTGVSDPEEQDVNDPRFDNMHFDDDDFDDYLQLGPLEVKVLNVSGQRAQIYKPATPDKEIVKAKDFRPDQWPVTHAMLCDTLKQESPRSPRDSQLISKSTITA